MAQQPERDFPVGHPKAVDTVPGSPEHLAWLRAYDASRGERDFPAGHPAAADTPGHDAGRTWRAGVDPLNPHLEQFTGYTPDRAAAIAAFNAEQAKHAREVQALPPLDANVANAALEAKRRALGVDVLTAEEHAEVIAALQAANAAAVQPVAAPTAADHDRAIRFLMFRKHTREQAEHIITQNGLRAVLAAANDAKDFKE